MNLLQYLFAPNVESAVGSLNKSLAKLEKAEIMHQEGATFHAEQANVHTVLSHEQNEAAERAYRIRSRLQDLLA